MNISLIVAMSSDFLIGTATGLPWHLPNDLKRFRKLTLGKPIILGRKTMDILGKPLPGRPHIVLTQQLNYQHEGCVIAHTIAGAILEAQALLPETGPWGRLSSLPFAEGRQESLPFGEGRQESLPFAEGRQESLPFGEGRQESLPHEMGQDEIMVIGGAAVYRSAMPLVRRVYATIVAGEFQGTIYLPEECRVFLGAEWDRVWEEELPIDERNLFASRFLICERRAPS